MTSQELLIAEAIFFRGDWDKIYDAINLKKFLPNSQVAELNRQMKCKAITILDKDYPMQLRQMFKPPLVLFYYGDISLLKDSNKCLAVVGTRHPSAKGAAITKEIVSETSKYMVTVSGLAYGIDRIAHESAINSNGKTIAVLGCGINVCYPIENEDIYNEIKNNHLLISEYPEGVSPDPSKFPLRNRIIAGLSKGVLVTESKIQSGTSITARFALDSGIEVMCVPSNDYNQSGCNLHIKQGAALVESAKDVLFVLDAEKLL